MKLTKFEMNNLSPSGNLTEYFVYDSFNKVLRATTEDEDLYLRENDLNDNPIRDLKDCEWIVSKSLDNKISKWSDKNGI